MLATTETAILARLHANLAAGLLSCLRDKRL
jgi:hypothetical protein